MQELQETRVQSVCWEDSLEEKMATHSSILLLLLHFLGDTITRLTVSSHFEFLQLSAMGMFSQRICPVCLVA